MRRFHVAVGFLTLLACLTLGCADKKARQDAGKLPSAKSAASRAAPVKDAVAKDEAKTSAKKAESPRPDEMKTPAKEAESPRPDQAKDKAAKAPASPDEAKRVAAINALAEKGEATPEVLATLTKELKSDSPSIRAHAAHALGDFGQAAKSAVEPLAALVTDPDQTVRREVVRAMASIRPGPEVTIPLLKKALDDAAAETNTILKREKLYGD